MRRVGLVCAMRGERDCLSRPGGAEWNPLEPGPFETSSAALGDTEAVCVVSGIGKAAAAAATQYLVERFSPVLIVSFGLAGALSASARTGELVLPSVVLQGDTGIYDRGGFQAPVGWEEGVGRRRFHHEYPADPAVHEWGRGFLEERGVDHHTGPLVTCDQAVFSSHRRRELHHTFHAVAVDMESGAIAQAAALNHVPFCAFRALSDAHDLEMEDASRLASLQADSIAAKVKGALGTLADRRQRGFIMGLREGSNLALERLGGLLPDFVEHCPFPA